MNRMIRIWILLLPFTLVFVGTGYQENSLRLPMSASLQYSARLATVELLNESDRAITAWSLRITWTFDNGEAQDEILIQDFAASSGLHSLGDPAELHIDGPFVPGQTHVLSLDVPSLDGASVLDVAVRVAALVHEDRSYEGDPLEVREIFEDRRARIMAQRHWLDQLSDLPGRTRGEPSLREACTNIERRLEEGLDNYGEDDRLSSDHPAARLFERGLAVDIQSALERSAGGELSQVLQQVIDQLRESHEIMTQHVTPTRKIDLRVRGSQ